MAVVVGATIVVWGCENGGSSPRTRRVRSTYRIAAFESEAPSRIRRTGEVHSRWLDVGGVRQPAIVSHNDLELDVHPTWPEGARLRARYALLGPSTGSARAAIFRVRIGPRSGAGGALLFEDRISPAERGSPRELSLELPVASPAISPWLSLEVEVQAEDGERAAWIDPRVEGWARIPAPAATAPNVLLVTLDTTRQDFPDCYGGAADAPALSRLAGDGYRFASAYAVAFGTAPSHASLMTGAYAFEHGVYDNESVLAGSRTTLAEALRRDGYQTAAFVSARVVERALGFGQGFDTFDDLFLEDSASQLGPTYSPFERGARGTVDAFLTWLEATPEGPFFAWIHLFDPHQPYLPLAGDRPASEVDSYFTGERGGPGYLHAESVPEELRIAVDREARRRYRGELERADAQLGRVLQALDRRGLYDRTLIAVAGDHGESFLDRGEELAYNHAGLFAEVSRIPVILKPASGSGGGGWIDQLVGNLDVAPTLLDLLGVAPPAGWSGRSVARWLDGRVAQPFRSSLLLEGAYRHEVAVRTRSWFYRELSPAFRGSPQVGYLGYRQGQPRELYRLETDPRERDPLGFPAGSPLYRRIRDTLRAVRQASSSDPTRRLEDAGHLKALRALGYL